MLKLRETYYYLLLQLEAQQSMCKDKKVAALWTQQDIDTGTIVLAHNIATGCNDKCDHTCGAIHAEEVLCRNNSVKGGIIYLTLYPCEVCQCIMQAHNVEKVVVFNNKPPHKKDLGRIKIECKPDIIDTLATFNGPQRQAMVAMGEMGELITALADAFRGDDRPQIRSIDDEIVDVILQMLILLRGKQIIPEWSKKINKLIAKAETGAFNADNDTVSFVG
jgi:deoxycytidylate deaminase